MYSCIVSVIRFFVNNRLIQPLGCDVIINKLSLSICVVGSFIGGYCTTITVYILTCMTTLVSRSMGIIALRSSHVS